MSIYKAHRRETPNALDASVRCEQKCLQRLSETVPANNRVTQVVRQGIPDRRTSHTVICLHFDIFCIFSIKCTNVQL